MDMQCAGVISLSHMQERKLTDGAFAFYNLTADWLLRLASPSYATTSTPDVQLPAEAPLHFRILPVPLPLSDLSEHPVPF